MMQVLKGLWRLRPLWLRRGRLPEFEIDPAWAEKKDARTGRFILLISGGALRGPFSVPIIEHVWDLYGEPDEIGGTSIGALHTLALAAGLPQVLRFMWDLVDKRWQMLSVPLDFGAGFIRNGFISMNPAKRLLRKYGIGKTRRIPAYVGVTDAATGEGKMLSLGEHVSYAVALANTFVSGSLSPAMQIVRYLDPRSGRWRFGYDRGLFAVLPRSSHRPRRRDHEFTQEDVSTFLGMFGAQLDHIVDEAVKRDIEYLKTLARYGVSVSIYAPKSWEDVGASWKYSAELREHRYASGDAAVARGPVRMGPALREVQAKKRMATPGERGPKPPPR
jgi:hypothetical protein